MAQKDHDQNFAAQADKTCSKTYGCLYVWHSTCQRLRRPRQYILFYFFQNSYILRIYVYVFFFRCLGLVQLDVEAKKRLQFRNVGLLNRDLSVRRSARLMRVALCIELPNHLFRGLQSIALRKSINKNINRTERVSIEYLLWVHTKKPGCLFLLRRSWSWQRVAYNGRQTYAWS
jgi:hypothetical protein